MLDSVQNMTYIERKYKERNVMIYGNLNTIRTDMKNSNNAYRIY